MLSSPIPVEVYSTAVGNKIEITAKFMTEAFMPAAED